uniref:Putative lipocalin-3 1 n=1 Tax=Amblyomma triste TaxID=251400 RepID=A0A023GE05_AMBTT
MYALSAVVVFFAAEATAFSPTELRHGFNTSIEEFYSTPEPVWTYESMVGADVNLSCLVDVTANISRSYLYFQRFYYLNGERHKNRLVRLLDPVHPNKSRSTLVYDGDHPIYEQKNPLFQETLLYQSNDSSCGVFAYFQHQYVFRYDLRVWNCSLAVGPEKDCLQYFNEVYSFHKGKPPVGVLKKRRVYNQTCHSIFNPLDGC